MIETAKNNILTPLINAGYSAFIVGGTVREMLLNNDNITDVDIATNASHSAIKNIFPTSFDLSRNMNLNVFLVKINDFTYELAQFRGNEVYSNGRTPDSVEHTNDAKLDAKRRDFTINGLFMDKEGNIIDYVGGLADINKKILRAIGSPSTRFDEDVLRILRGIRFAVQYDLSIDPNTYLAMRKKMSGLLNLVPERITAEFDKMMSLGCKKFADALVIMHKIGILDILLPEIAILDKFEHSPLHHPEGNVFKHSIAAVKSCDSTDPVTIWSILLHDVGKAVTYKLREKNGEFRHTYYGHDKAGEEIINNISNRLKLPTKTTDIAKFCATNHMLCHRLQEMKPNKILALVENTYFDYLMTVSDCDVASRGDGTITEELNRRRDFITKFKEHTAHILNITGNAVMEVCNIQEGPKVGSIIKKTREWAVNSNETDFEKIKKKMIELNKSC